MVLVLGAGEEQGPKSQEDLVWAQLAFPFYLQQATEESQPQKGPCSAAAALVDAATGTDGAAQRDAAQQCVWSHIRCVWASTAAESYCWGQETQLQLSTAVQTCGMRFCRLVMGGGRRRPLSGQLQRPCRAQGGQAACIDVLAPEPL